MKRFRRVWVVYRKELIETLRDKRTLAAMILVPIVLYPVLMIIIMEALRAETGRRRTERYSVCVPDDAHRRWLRGVLEREDAELAARPGAPAPSTNPPERNALDGGDPLSGIEIDSGAGAMDPAAAFSARLRSDQVDIVVLPSGASLWEPVADHVYHAAVIVQPPPNPDDPFDGVNRVAQILRSDTNPRSEFVFGELNDILADEADRIVRARVAKFPGGAATLTPILTSNVSTSSPQKQFARILAMVLPFLLVVMTVTGALYPAIDLTAGERERGTLETLAVSPVPVGQIVAGKFGVIVTIALFSTALNLGSMTAMFHFSRLAQMAVTLRPNAGGDGGAAERLIESRPQEDSDRPTQLDYLERRRALEARADAEAGIITSSAPIILLAMAPFAVLAGAVMLATCSFARTFKEAQNYMMPVMMAFIIPAMVVSYMPTTRLEGLILVMPVANIVVLIRELFLGNYDGPAMAICLLSTCFYAVAAVALAGRLYGHEAVLFSDVGSYKTLLQRRFIKPKPAPSPAAALTTVALLFPVYFYWQSYLVDPSGGSGAVAWVIVGSQVLVLAAPAVLIAWYLRLDLAETFQLRAPRATAWFAAALLAVSVVPVANLLRQIQFIGFPPRLDMLEAQERLLLGGSLAGMILAFAVVPAVCEELLFRGLLLSGLRRRMRPLQAAVVVGLIFGLFHLYVEKIPVHSLIGALLAWVCIRGGSIFPAMLVHLANNALPLAATRLPRLAGFLGLDAFEADPAAVQFNLRTAVYLAVFLAALLILARGGARPRTFPIRHSGSSR